jgi:hypothetical protein
VPAPSAPARIDRLQPRSRDIGAMYTEKPARPVSVAVNTAKVATATTTQP